ncbi:MAG: D-aminoacyl-tRNA deacylase [Candidatus Thorarchaeota archaeon]|jgi:D-aminoacyl-tRNA deacylase
MVKVLVASTQDIASQTISEVLREEHGFQDSGESFEGSPVYSHGNSNLLITTNRDLIFANHLEQHFDAEVFIFCSRHRAQSGRPALLVHSTGNFGVDASFGGEPQQLSVSIASLVSTALRRLRMERDRRALDEFDVTLEVTHHGPTSMKTPLLFVELGSEELHWRNKDGAMSVAAAVMDCVQAPIESEASIGFGGTHYASKFNKLVLDKDVKMGHISPKYALNEITASLVHQMIGRSREKITKAIIDWKGTNAENKAKLFPILEECNLEVIRASKV